MKEYVVSVVPNRNFRDFVERHPITRRDSFYYTQKAEPNVWPTVYCDDEVSAVSVAEILAAQYPGCNVLVAKTSVVIQAPAPVKFTRTKLTEAGLLPA